jgi:hypothetical protein
MVFNHLLLGYLAVLLVLEFAGSKQSPVPESLRPEPSRDRKSEPSDTAAR